MKTAAHDPVWHAFQRLHALLRAWSPLSGAPPARDRETILDALDVEIVSDASTPRLWAIVAAAWGRMPEPQTTVRFERNVTVYGSRDALLRLVHEVEGAPAVVRNVEFVVDAVMVDVHDTSGTSKITGIQRVVRETVRRWHTKHPLTLVAWTDDGTALRGLADWERDSLLGLSSELIDERSTRVAERGRTSDIVVPLGGTFVVAELTAEVWRTSRLRSLALHSGLSTVVIGYDAVPMTSSETSSDGIAAQFPLYLQAIAGADRVGAISGAAATEFRGWKRMLAAAGESGPLVETIDLAAEVPGFTAGDVAEARETLGLVPGQRVVLVVGSHEPRKNHLSVIQAAKGLWASGHDFRLVFIGGGSWNTERFHSEIALLRKAGRPVIVVSSAPDGILAAAYSLADFTVFPSLHEGFGLPVAESLALGTPVVTSNYGSMREIIEAGGGGLLVDPRDDGEVEEAMRRLLDEPSTLSALRLEADARTVRTWDAYADDLWDFFLAPNAR